MAKRGSNGRSGAPGHGTGRRSTAGTGKKGTAKTKGTGTAKGTATAKSSRGQVSRTSASLGETSPIVAAGRSEPWTFRLGAVPGTTPGTWISRWRERMPDVALELIPLAVADQRDALFEGRVDAALVRSPLDRADLNAIALYDEVPVVVVSIDSALTAVDELDAADLEGEVVIVPADDVLGPLRLSGTVAPAFAAPADTAEAIEIAASGVGVVIVPMSLARANQRRDVTSRPLRGGPVSSISLAWLADAPSDDIETFVGIVRGRTPNSSR